MGYVYAAVFCLIGILVVVRMGKINKIFFLAGVIFELMAAWWLVNTLYPDLGIFQGVWGLIFRGFMVVFIIAAFYVVYRERHREPGHEKKDTDDTENE